MTKKSLTVLFVLLICSLLLSCSSNKSKEKTVSPSAGDTTADMSEPMDVDSYMEELVDNFLIVVDASGSKFRPYKGRIKLRLTKDLIQRFNDKVPDRPLTGGLRRYGFEAGAFSQPTELLFGVSKYSRREYARAIDVLRWAGGKSPMSLALNAGTLDLKSTTGYIAVVIFSDGKINDNDPDINDVITEMDNNLTLKERYRKLADLPIVDKIVMEMESDEQLAGKAKAASSQIMQAQNNPDRINMILKNNPGIAERLSEIDKDPVFAAKMMVLAASLPSCDTINATKAMKATYGDRICIYTVLVGDLPYGGLLLDQIARIGGCGYAVTSDFLASDKNMADFVHDVFTRSKPRFVEERIEACPDRDGDGVCDQFDECPDTPEGARVDERGCWILDKVHFDLNKWNIKPKYYTMLDEIAQVLIKNPHVKMGVHGHTCTIWTEQYNMKLSHWRALSVTSYLLKKGVPSRQLSVKGFGFHQPFASNKTEEGRILNRRVEFHPVW